jgi:hypothetical protein
MSMDPVRLKERCDDLESRLRETSMLAAKAWKGRNSKNTGKQLVLYQVEEVSTSFCAVSSMSPESQYNDSS